MSRIPFVLPLQQPTGMTTGPREVCHDEVDDPCPLGSL